MINKELNIESIEVVYEDNHLLIVNKVAGLLVQGDKTGDITLLDIAKHYLKTQYHKPGNVFVGLPHRIDRPVSGIVVLTKTSKALSRMVRLFHDRLIEKTYIAVTHGQPVEKRGTLIHYLAQNKRGKKSFVVSDQDDRGQRSKLDYKVLSTSDDLALLQIKPFTGRKHQIRVQLSYSGCPIVGDLKYGSARKLGHYIALHAYKIAFMHPVKKEWLQITAPMPSPAPWSLFDQHLKKK